MKLWMAPGGLHIEPGRIEDAGRLANIHAEGFFRGWPAADFAAYLGDPDATPAYVACTARRDISGFLLLRLAGAEAEVLTLAVTRSRRNKGIGEALMRAGIEDLLSTSARKLVLEVEDANMAALGLYRTLGFYKIGVRTSYYARPEGPAATAQVLQLDLD